MLILERKLNEKIDIGGNVVLTVIQIFRDKVRIGIEAPKDVAVHRREVSEAIARQNKSAGD